MKQSSQTPLLVEYDSLEPLYRDFASTLCVLLERILKQELIQVHGLTHRPKDKAELGRKLAGPSKDYLNLSDVTDLAGVRVTTYFANDVDRVAQIVEREFDIDSPNFVDKRRSLDPDRFGYLSLHYVVTLPDRRRKLTEYGRFGAMKAEIQIRSILQHAWAEIEHDLGYKSKASVPREIQRRFARVAGLLELADAEFDAIRQQLSEYSASIPTAIEESPERVTLDKVSLSSYLRSSVEARNLDKAIATLAGAKISKRSDEAMDRILQEIDWFGIKTIAELDGLVRSNSKIAIDFARQWISTSKIATLNRGIGLYYVLYVVIGSADDTGRVRAYLDAVNIGRPADRDALVKRIITAYKSAKKQGKS